MKAYNKKTEPISVKFNGTKISILARICSGSLTPSPKYASMADIMFISSAIQFDRDRIIRIHSQNLVKNPYFILSTYNIKECVITRKGKKNLGRIIKKSVDQFLTLAKY